MPTLSAAARHGDALFTSQANRPSDEMTRADTRGTTAMIIAEHTSCTMVPEHFVSGLEGVVAFTSDIAEPDKDGGALRYRGVDIEELLEGHVTFGNVWALPV